MIRTSLLFSIILLQACSTHHVTNSSPAETEAKPTDTQQLTQINNQLPHGLKLNLYRTSEISQNSDLWNEQPIKVKKISFEQLNTQEQTIYKHIENDFLNEWIKCDNREFKFTNSNFSAFPFFEVKNYQPRVEINTTPLNSLDIQQNIQWKGNIRIGFYQSLANDVVPFHPYREPSPTYTLPNFSSSSTLRNITLENGKIYYVERNKKTELITTTETRDCKFVQEILETTLPAES